MVIADVTDLATDPIDYDAVLEIATEMRGDLRQQLVTGRYCPLDADHEPFVATTVQVPAGVENLKEWLACVYCALQINDPWWAGNGLDSAVMILELRSARPGETVDQLVIQVPVA